MDRNKAIILTVVLAVLFAGTIAWRYRSKQVEFTVEVIVPQAGVSRMVMLADGRAVAEAPITPTQRAVRAVIPGRPRRDYGAEMFPELTARLEGPCGTRAATVKLRTPLDAPQMRAAIAEGRASVTGDTVVAPGQKRRDATLWMDNREGPERRLSVGGQEHVVPANATTRYGLAYDASCPAGREVRLDGVPIGALPESLRETKIGESFDAFDLALSSNYLVDPAGKRCYTYTETFYTRGGGLGIGPQSRSYRNARLHRIPRSEVDYFLEAAPRQVREFVPLGVTMVTRVSLRGGPCGGEW